METIKITLGGETVTLRCNLSEASAPLLVDGEQVGQTADARHRTANAVLIAARHAWPDTKWPAVPQLGSEHVKPNDAWDELAYTTVEDGEDADEHEGY
jgi:hypothetical protein